MLMMLSFGRLRLNFSLECREDNMFLKLLELRNIANVEYKKGGYQYAYIIYFIYFMFFSKL